MENVIEVRNLVKSYKSFKLNSISFDIPKGMIVGLIGVKRLSCFYRILLIHCANVQNATNNSLVFKFCLCYDLLKAFR